MDGRGSRGPPELSIMFLYGRRCDAYRRRRRRDLWGAVILQNPTGENQQLLGL